MNVAKLVATAINAIIHLPIMLKKLLKNDPIELSTLFVAGGVVGDSLITACPTVFTLMGSPFICSTRRGVFAAGITIHAMR